VTHFAVWTVLGAALGLGVLSLLTIGFLVLPLAAAASLAALPLLGPDRGLAGLVSGLGVPLLYVAWLNRGGPGEVCRTTTDGFSCADAWSPWPWALAGLVLVGVGLAVFAAAGRGRRGLAAPGADPDPR
jgi:membrane protease YdiL (CAAX protease family)